MNNRFAWQQLKGLDREQQEELLLIRNDIFTLYRQVFPHGDGGADNALLFPLRYARTKPTTTTTPVMIVPGGPGAASILPYESVRRAFQARDLEVIMMEHRGVGLSRLDARGRDLPLRAVTIENVVADMLAVLDHARVEQVCLYGCGYGALLSVAFALAHPDRVASLVLDSPALSRCHITRSRDRLRDVLWWGKSAREADIAEAARTVIADLDLDPHAAGYVFRLVYETSGPSSLRDLLRLLLAGRGDLTWQALLRIIRYDLLDGSAFLKETDLVAGIYLRQLGFAHASDGLPFDTSVGLRPVDLEYFPGAEVDLVPQLGKLDCPVTVVSGAWDLSITPQISAEVAAAVPQGVHIVLPGVGHGVLDVMASTAAIITQWTIAGCVEQLLERVDELADLPRSPVNQLLMNSIQVALTAARINPVRSRVKDAQLNRKWKRAKVGKTVVRRRRVKPNVQDGKSAFRSK